MPDDIEKAVFKEALKEAINEWLDKKFTELGKWTLKGITALAFSALIYATLITHGWRK